MRSELEVSADASAVQKDMQRKRDEEFVDLKKQIQEEAKEHEAQMASLRTKHNNLVEKLNNQLDQFKRTKTSLGMFQTFLLSILDFTRFLKMLFSEFFNVIKELL